LRLDGSKEIWVERNRINKKFLKNK
jgi:hypothetical protein